MTTTISHTEHQTFLSSGRPYGTIVNKNSVNNANACGFLYGEPRDYLVGRNSIRRPVYGGTSNHYILKHPGTEYLAHIVNDANIFNFKITYRSDNTERFLFECKSPNPDRRKLFPNELIHINNGLQLFDFFHPTRFEEDSYYNAIILANGQPMMSILDLNRHAPRRRATYCYPTNDTCPSCKFHNPDDPNQYIRIHYSYLFKDSVDTSTLDVCIGNYWDGKGNNEVFDLKPFLLWHSSRTVRGKRIKHYVSNYCAI